MWVAQDGADVLGGRRVGITRSMSPAKRARIAYEPYGVVGVIGAGSAPFAQPLGQIAGALLAGNAVVFKPAARAALAGERIMRVLARAGLPEGLVRIAHGGADVGVALAQSGADKILFTGSPAVARVVARACVSREKEVAVELGGKDAMLVLADAHLTRAVAGALWAGCAGAGQARGSIERIYVAREVHDRFLAGPGERRARDDRRRPGRPADAGRPAGVRAPRGARQRPRGRGRGRRRPACTAAAPSTRPDASPGVFYAPGDRQRPSPPRCASCASRSTARCWPSSRSTTSRRRSAWRTTCDYGLGASVWTADRYRGIRIARELHAGMVWLNDHLPGPDALARPVGRGGRRRPRAARSARPGCARARRRS